MDLSTLSRETLLSIIRDQQDIIDNYKEKDNKKENINDNLCKCRVWNGFPNKQCSRKRLVNGYCKIHNEHVIKWGQWHLGEMDGPKPTFWGEFCDYVPSDRKRGYKIQK